LAIDDCKKALAIDSKYSKAYSRLGLAYYSLDQYEEAVEAYTKALDLDPSNELVKTSLQTAESKLNSRSKAAPIVEEPAASGNPLDALGGLGGMGGLAGLMNNPALMSMASKMMQDPQMASMYVKSYWQR
jgi:tetratricopeptide (TPR) repeat protein